MVHKKDYPNRASEIEWDFRFNLCKSLLFSVLSNLWLPLPGRSFFSWFLASLSKPAGLGIFMIEVFRPNRCSFYWEFIVSIFLFKNNFPQETAGIFPAPSLLILSLFSILRLWDWFPSAHMIWLQTRLPRGSSNSWTARCLLPWLLLSRLFKGLLLVGVIGHGQWVQPLDWNKIQLWYWPVWMNGL